MHLYGNREEILTKHYGNTKRKRHSKGLVRISQSHRWLTADTIPTHSDKTDLSLPSCTELAHLVSLPPFQSSSIIPFDTITLICWAPSSLCFRAVTLTNAAPDTCSPRSSMHTTCPHPSIFCFSCVTVKHLFHPFKIHLWIISNGLLTEMDQSDLGAMML